VQQKQIFFFHIAVQLIPALCNPIDVPGKVCLNYGAEFIPMKKKARVWVGIIIPTKSNQIKWMH
jgi:hypothetical protein